MCSIQSKSAIIDLKSLTQLFIHPNSSIKVSLKRKKWTKKKIQHSTPLKGWKEKVQVIWPSSTLKIWDKIFVPVIACWKQYGRLYWTQVALYMTILVG